MSGRPARVAGVWEPLGKVASRLTNPCLLSPRRLMEHEDDPDVDEPLETPLSHVLGREPTPSEQVGPEGPDWETSCDSRDLERAPRKSE